MRERWESWDALAGLGAEFATEHPGATTADLVDELEARARAQHSPDGQGVTLGTLHAAKGLEWDAVALAGAQEGSLPFVLATSPDDIAEERRLFYVGITRAREHLRISGSTSRKGTGARRSPTRFLDGLVAVPAAATSGPGRRRRGSAQSRVCRACGRPWAAVPSASSAGIPTAKPPTTRPCGTTCAPGGRPRRTWRAYPRSWSSPTRRCSPWPSRCRPTATRWPASAASGRLLARYGDGLLEVLARHR